jgi:hypothetical protein
MARIKSALAIAGNFQAMNPTWPLDVSRKALADDLRKIAAECETEGDLEAMKSASALAAMLDDVRGTPTPHN